MQAHLIQFDIQWENKSANHERVRALIDESPIEAGDIIVLPELFDVGFTLNTDIACDLDDTTLEFLKQLALDTGCTIHGARATRADQPGRAYNNATITFPDGSQHIDYRKVHPFSYGREMDAYDPGDTLKHYDWKSKEETLRVCPAVCYDLRFPELFRIAAKDGAQVIILGASWPTPRAMHWRTLLIARAIENQAFVFGVNRCGNDPYLRYHGGSIAVDPKGLILGELDEKERVLSVEIDTEIQREWRSEFPALRDIKLI